MNRCIKRPRPKVIWCFVIPCGAVIRTSSRMGIPTLRRILQKHPIHWVEV